MLWLRAEAMGIVAVSLGVAAIGFVVPAMVSGEPPAAPHILLAATGVPSFVTGVVLLWVRPRNAVGLLLAFAGLVAVWVGGQDNYLAVAQQLAENDAGSLPVSRVAVALLQGTWMLFYLPWAWLLLVFPSGKLLVRSVPGGAIDRWLAISLPVLVVVFSTLVALGPLELAMPQISRAEPLLPGADVLAVLLLPIFLAMLIACVFRFKARYRQALAAEKVQMRWLAAAGILLPATLLLCWASYLLMDTADAVILGLVLIYLALPAAVAIAVFRAELFNVDRVMAASIVATVLGAVGLSVLAAAAGAAAAVIGHQSTLVTACVTAALLLLLIPIHKRLARWLDQRLYPHRWRVLQAVAALNEDVQLGLARPEILEERLREALACPTLKVGYHLPGTGHLVTGYGEPLTPGPAAVRIDVAGTPVGVVDYGTERLHELPLDRDVLASLATSMLPVALRMELAQALEEVAASRSRILAASYVARQRLERDLHDGAQQRLVALGMALRLAQRHLGEGQTHINGVLDGAVSELGTVVAEIRQLAHGVRPSSLNDGLPAALAQLCHAAPFAIDLELDLGQGTAETIPDGVGTTAYFVASEAVANAAKYAQASRIAVSLDHHGTSIRIGVTDNGGGGAVVRQGGGLAGLLDRVSAQGGTMNVVSLAGRGTLVEALLPCG